MHLSEAMPGEGNPGDIQGDSARFADIYHQQLGRRDGALDWFCTSEAQGNHAGFATLPPS